MDDTSINRSPPDAVGNDVDVRQHALEWLAEFGDDLFAYAMQRVNDSNHAEELVQETLMAAIRKYASFRGDSGVKTWLISILRHKIVDHFRSRARRREVAYGEGEGLDVFFSKHGHLKNVSAWKDLPETRLENAEFHEVLNDCVEKLGDTLAAPFVLRTMDGLKTETICQILNISATNLSVRLHRGRLQLRECLERNWFGRDAE